jgi:ribosomal protein L11 methyltransferase
MPKDDAKIMPQRGSAPGDGFAVSLAATEADARALAERLAAAPETETLPISLFEAGQGGWRVVVHCPDAETADSVRALMSDAGTVLVEPLERRDWVAASLAGLSPVRAGRFFVHGAHDRERVPANALAIELEAALAFGTGHHGTTRGCLLALDRLLKARRPRRVLDLGTGTAVLAIAAAKALRREVVASDLDPQAVRIAQANARANGVGRLVTPLRADGLRDRRLRARGPYDLILANILLGPLRRLARPLARVISPGGRVVLSGLLPAHAVAALSAYRLHGLRLERRFDLDGWTTLVLRRPNRNRAFPRSRPTAQGGQGWKAPGAGQCGFCAPAGVAAPPTTCTG